LILDHSKIYQGFWALLRADPYFTNVSVATWH